METPVKWTRTALSDLDEIYEFYATESTMIAEMMVNKIYFADRPLRTMPYAGAIEPFLANRKKSYRSLVVEKHFKLIYYIEKGILFITSVWDTRRDPDYLSHKVYPL